MSEAEYVLTFAQYYPYGPQYFVFGGFFRVKPVEPKVGGGLGYKLTRLQEHDEYAKRLIIKLEQPVGRDLYLRWYEGRQADFTFDGSATRGAIVSEMHYKGRVGRVDRIFIGLPDEELPHGESALARLGIGFTLDYFALRQLSSARLVIKG